MFRILAFSFFSFCALGIKAQSDCNCANSADFKKYQQKMNGGGESGQICSQCAHLASYLCMCECPTITDKSAIKANIEQIKQTLRTYKANGSDVCCPELLNKTVPCSVTTATQTGNSAKSSSAAVVQKLNDATVVSNNFKTLNDTNATVSNKLNAANSIKEKLKNDPELLAATSIVGGVAVLSEVVKEHKKARETNKAVTEQNRKNEAEGWKRYTEAEKKRILIEEIGLAKKYRDYYRMLQLLNEGIKLYADKLSYYNFHEAKAKLLFTLKRYNECREFCKELKARDKGGEMYATAILYKIENEKEQTFSEPVKELESLNQRILSAWEPPYKKYLLINRANVYNNLGKYEEALSDLAQAINMPIPKWSLIDLSESDGSFEPPHPDHLWMKSYPQRSAYALRAESKLNLKDTLGCLKDMDQAIVENPFDTLSPLMSQYIYNSRNDKENAEKQKRNYYTAFRYASVAKLLTKADTLLNNKLKAEMYDLAVITAPDLPVALYSAMMFDIGQKNYSGAENKALQLQKIKPDFKDINFIICKIYALAGKNKEAYENLLKFGGENPTNIQSILTFPSGELLQYEFKPFRCTREYEKLIGKLVSDKSQRDILKHTLRDEKDADAMMLKD